MLMTNMDQPGPFVRRRNTFIIGIVCFHRITGYWAYLSIPRYCCCRNCPVWNVLFSYRYLWYPTFSNGILNACGICDSYRRALWRWKSYSDFGYTYFGRLMGFSSVFILSKIQPYILVKQILGENFIELGNFIRIKSKFYRTKPDFDALFHEMMSSQIKLKEHHEDLREILFTTRTYVNESTTTSRIIMLMFWRV